MTENISDIKKKVSKRVQMLEHYGDVFAMMHLNNPEDENILGVKNYIHGIYTETKQIEDGLNDIDKYALHYASINNAFKERTDKEILSTLLHNMKVAQVNIKDYIPLTLSKEDQEKLNEINTYAKVHLEEFKEAINNNPFEEQVNAILKDVALSTKDMMRVEVSPLEIEEASYVFVTPDESNVVLDDTIIPEQDEVK